MELLLIAGTLITGGLLNFIVKLKPGFVYNLAVAFIFTELILSVCYWLFCVPEIKSPILPLILSGGGLAGNLILGYLTINILKTLMSSGTGDYNLGKVTNLTLWGVTILTALSFLTESCWTAENLCKMTAFFTSSGYTTWFLYFIMIAEALGGLGILLHFKLKTGPVAAAGLMLVMIGALYTHRHNNDPISGSYAAISELITLGLLELIYHFEQLVSPKLTEYPAIADNKIVN